MLQGFVSNKDADTTGERGDPIEGLLYATFISNTERADVASLADVLNVDLQQLAQAVSIACRLGFGTRREAHRLLPAAMPLPPVSSDSLHYQRDVFNGRLTVSLRPTVLLPINQGCQLLLC